MSKKERFISRWQGRKQNKLLLKRSTTLAFSSFKLFVMPAFRFAEVGLGWVKGKSSANLSFPGGELRNLVFPPSRAAQIRVMHEDFSAKDSEEEQKRNREKATARSPFTLCFFEYLIRTTIYWDACCIGPPKSTVILSVCTHLILWIKNNRRIKIPLLITLWAANLERCCTSFHLF